MELPEPLLRVENLSKVFVVGLFTRRRIDAVKGVSFTIGRREIVSLVGESGSGKTTTAKIILRLEKPTSGRVLFEGRDVWRDLRSREDILWYRRSVQGVMQDPYGAFNPFYRVDRVFKQMFKLLPKDMDDEERWGLVEKALIEVGLNPRYVLGKYPHELSGGERQRVMIARALLVEPKLLIADEPVSMLDATLRSGILKLLMKLRDERGLSILFITHDMGLAYYVSDRILVMYRGELVEEGRPDELIESPRHPYTKRLISDIPLLYRKWSDI